MKYDTIVKIVDDVKGTKFASIDTETPVTLLGGKKNPLQGRVTKRTLGSTIILTNTPENVYSNMVKKRLIEEGKDHTTFELKPRKWGKRVDNTCFIEHTDKSGIEKIYLETIFVKGGKSNYYVDGQETDPSTIEGLKLEEKETSDNTEKAVQQGGLENKVIIRTYDVNSIISVRVDGEAFV